MFKYIFEYICLNICLNTYLNICLNLLLLHQSRFLNNHQSLEYMFIKGTKFLSD